MIRAASVRDLSALQDLEERCFAERRFRGEHILWILRNPRAATWVYENGGIVAALMILNECDLTRVISIGVHPKHRRQGIGRELMGIVEAVARRRHAGEVRLEVSTKNEGAIAFYRALGYQLLERLPEYYSWGDDAYAMAKPIAAEARNP